MSLSGWNVIAISEASETELSIEAFTVVPYQVAACSLVETDTTQITLQELK
jgi:hypothetical protein